MNYGTYNQCFVGIIGHDMHCRHLTEDYTVERYSYARTCTHLHVFTAIYVHSYMNMSCIS